MQLSSNGEDIMNLTSHVYRWLKGARQQLKKDPTSDLSNYTAINYGAYGAWDFGVASLYSTPKTPDDWYLGGQVHEMLLIAFNNHIGRAEKLSPQKWDAVKCRDVVEAYRLATMMAQRDPVSCVLIKIRLNLLCERFETTFTQLMQEPDMLLDPNELVFMQNTREWLGDEMVGKQRHSW